MLFPRCHAGRPTALHCRACPRRATSLFWHRPAGLRPSRQAILESDWGRSTLACEHNNYFGIKARARANGSDADYATTEYSAGRPRRQRARFARFDSLDACLDDYARILSLPRYARARAVATNPFAFAVELQRCGYATDPRYARKLALLVRRYRLTRFDLAPAESPQST